MITLATRLTRNFYSSMSGNESNYIGAVAQKVVPPLSSSFHKVRKMSYLLPYIITVENMIRVKAVEFVLLADLGNILEHRILLG
jgi:hypothetical protein